MPPLALEYAADLRAQGFSESLVNYRLRLWRLLGDPATATKADVLRIMNLDPAYSDRYKAHMLSQMRRLFADLAAMGVLEADPTLGVRKPRKPDYLPRPLSPRQVDVLLEIGGRVTDWAILGLYAGLRRAEVLAVEPDHLVEDRRGPTLLVPRGKGGKRATIPAHPVVVEVLRQRRPGTGRIWPLANVSFGDVWRRAMKKHGLEGVTFHQCRHTAVTRVYEASGADLLSTQAFARHASVSTTQVYAKVADERVYRAVAGL